MSKVFAFVLALLAVLSAVPIITHVWFTNGPDAKAISFALPEDISTHGHEIDSQISETMWEAGLSFLGAQLLLALFVWQFGGRTTGENKSLPGGAKGLVVFAILLVGVEAIALNVVGTKAWGSVYFKPAAPDALQVQAQAGQFAFYFRYPGADGKFGAIHPEKIDEGNSNFFGLDPANEVESRDDIVSGSLAIPVNREVHLMMHAKDVGHSFYVRELRVQQDFVPGLDLSLHFTATKTGRYEIVCTQLCGLGHYNMKAYLEVMSQADFDAWLKQQAGQ